MNKLIDPALAALIATFQRELGLHIRPWIFSSYHFVGLTNPPNSFGEIIVFDDIVTGQLALAGFVVGNTGGKDYPQYQEFAGQDSTAQILTPITVAGNQISAMSISIRMNAALNLVCTLVPNGITSTEIPASGSWMLKTTWFQWTWVGAPNPATPPIPQPPQPPALAPPASGEFSK